MRWHRGMASRGWLSLALLSTKVVMAADTCVFKNPSDAQAGFGSGFASNPISHIGETLPVTWNTSAKNYTVAVWQQNPAGGSAKLGPVVFQSSTSETATTADWEVQLYSFRLSDSPIFFFWLREGAASLQGLSGGVSCTSHYFNISSDPISSTTSTSATSSPTSSSAQSSSTTSNTATSTPEASSGLSTGAQAGIGVGVGIVGVAAIGALIVWYRYLKKKSAALDAQKAALDQQAQQGHPPSDYPQNMSYYQQDGSTAYQPSTYGGTPKPPPSEAGHAPYSSSGYTASTTQWQQSPTPQQAPVELANNNHDRAELAS